MQSKQRLSEYESQPLGPRLAYEGSGAMQHQQNLFQHFNNMCFQDVALWAIPFVCLLLVPLYINEVLSSRHDEAFFHLPRDLIHRLRNIHRLQSQHIWTIQSRHPSQDWNCLSKDFATTTSETCKTAHGATINCDITLIGLVDSMRHEFKPTTADMERTCTTDCTVALDDYVKNVQKACSAPGDRITEVGVRSKQGDPFILHPVDLVGQVFQYVLKSSCRKKS